MGGGSSHRGGIFPLGEMLLFKGILPLGEALIWGGRSQLGCSSHLGCSYLRDAPVRGDAPICRDAFIWRMLPPRLLLSGGCSPTEDAPSTLLQLMRCVGSEARGPREDKLYVSSTPQGKLPLLSFPEVCVPPAVCGPGTQAVPRSSSSPAPERDGCSTARGTDGSAPAQP